MSVIGQEYKQPRVFAHDAWPVVTGAINYTWNTNSKSKPLDWAGILVTNAGTGYAVGNTITLTTTGGAGTAAVLTVDAIDAATGAVTDFSFDPTTVTNLGAGYSVGDTESDAGAGAFACTITNIDIPNTQGAGCCLYIGRAAGFTSLTVIMEAGVYDRSVGDGYPPSDVVTLGSVSAGSILPISVKQITTVLATNEVIALY